MSKDFKKLSQLIEDLQKANPRAVRPSHQQPFQEWFDALNELRRDEPPPVSSQQARVKPEASQTEPTQQAESTQQPEQAEPAQQADLPTPKTPKQANIQKLACFLYEDPKVRATIKTARMTREINEEWKRGGNKGDLATNKTVDAALGRSIR